MRAEGILTLAEVYCCPGAFEALEWLTNGDESVCIPLHVSGMGNHVARLGDASA